MAHSPEAASTTREIPSGGPAAPDPRPHASQDALAQVQYRIRDAESRLAEHLNGLRLWKRRWPEVFRYDPVRTKNLEKVLNHLQRLLSFLDAARRTKRPVDVTSLDALLDRLKEVESLSPHGAWELADALSLELIRCGDDSFIYVLLASQDLPPGRGWRKHFPDDDVQRLLAAFGAPGDDRGRCVARHVLEEVAQAQVQEYRYDRARAELRGIYLKRMASVLFVTLLLFCASFLLAEWDAAPIGGPPTLKLAPMVLSAGAVGSILSRALKLGGGSASAGDPQPPLGIRALVSGWKIFFAQPVIGAASAFLVFLVIRSELVRFGGSHGSSPAVMALIAFLAGFSEPFFIGTLDKVAGQSGGRL